MGPHGAVLHLGELLQSSETDDDLGVSPSVANLISHSPERELPLSPALPHLVQREASVVAATMQLEQPTVDISLPGTGAASPMIVDDDRLPRALLSLHQRIAGEKKLPAKNIIISGYNAGNE